MRLLHPVACTSTKLILKPEVDIEAIGAATRPDSIRLRLVAGPNAGIDGDEVFLTKQTIGRKLSIEPITQLVAILRPVPIVITAPFEKVVLNL